MSTAVKILITLAVVALTVGFVPLWITPLVPLPVALLVSFVSGFVGGTILSNVVWADDY